MGWKLQVCLLLCGSAILFAEDASSGRFKVIAKGALSGIQEPKQLLITNATQWAEIWQKHSVRNEPKPPLPEIDFSKQSVLFVALGQKRTGGYAVAITDLQKKGEKTEVTLQAT